MDLKIIAAATAFLSSSASAMPTDIFSVGGESFPPPAINVVETKDLVVTVEGDVIIRPGVPHEVAIKEMAEKQDTKKLCKLNVKYDYVLSLSGMITSLDVMWTIGFRPDGTVVYYHINPDAIQRKTYSEIGHALKCARE